MRKKRFKHPARVLALWAAVLAVVFGATLLGNVAMARYVAHVRAHDPAPHLNAAENSLNRNSYSEAWAQIERAREKAPDAPRVYKVMGDFHFHQKHWKEALEAYRTAIDKGTTSHGVYINALWALIELRYYRDAVAFGEQCIAQGFQEPIFPRYIAEAHLRRGEQNEAIPHLERALEGYVNDPYLMRQLAAAYRATGRKTRAATLEQRIAEVEAAVERLRGGK
ncbi:MAG TPA: tetratricopeptide repeat protein [Candidatus Hydrogenedentes bacterium]|nr:tetratricopeptide repeat protein [Candidatus Hydrogenedentota bacterium]